MERMIVYCKYVCCHPGAIPHRLMYPNTIPDVMLLVVEGAKGDQTRVL